MSQVWRIELFGGVRLVRDGQVVSRFRSRQVGSLLGYLARYPGRGHSRERLAEMLWPGASAGRGRASLSTALWALRQLLAASPAGPADVIDASQDTVCLPAAVFTSDVREFAGLLPRLRTASTARQRELMEQAVDLYAGDFMAGYYDDWILPEQAHFMGHFRDTLASLISVLEREGDMARAVQYAARAVDLDPLREEAHRRLIGLHLRAGDTAQARQQYARLEHVLARELATTPAAATRELVAGIRAPSPTQRGAAAAAFRTPAGTELRSGTFTVLMVDRGDRRGHGPLPALVRMELASQIRRYGGIDAGCVTKLSALFPGVEEALACVDAIRLAHPDAAGGGGADLRLALDLGRVEVDLHGCRGPAIRQASRLLRVGSPGQTLCSERAAALALPDLDPRLTLNDVGLYRLPGSSRPERVFTVHRQGLPMAAAPPLKALREGRGSVPAPPTPLFGRGPERARLAELAMDPAKRLVTVLGPAGIGKTRLALAVARDLLERQGHAVWYVPLAPVVSTTHLPAAILRVLQSESAPGSDPVEQLLRALGPEPCWLVLDNLEHLLPEGAGLLRLLLERRPHLHCLATSRQALGLPGEHRLPLGPLPSPTPAQGMEGLLQCPSVQLFVERTRSILPGFELTPTNVDAVRSLCAHLEGWPLAIVLAAGRSGVLAPAQLLKRLNRRFDLLVSPGFESADRHSSLRSAVESNMGLLSAASRRLLAGLSVFRGGCTAEAAEEVCQAPQGADHLAELAGCSLMASEIHGPRLRFHMLETIREYAAGLVPAADLEVHRLRHAEYFARYANSTVPRLGSSQAPDLLRELDSESDNLRAASSYALTANPECALALAGALGPYWEIRGFWQEGRQTLTAAIEHAPQAPALLREKALHQLGWLAYLLGERGTGRKHLEEALPLSRAAGHREGEVRLTVALAFVAQSQGRPDDAWRLYEQGLAMARQTEQWEAVALCLSGLAGIQADRGEFAAARTLHEQSLSQWRQ
jgi:predicted ATPase/DNA-binding SARP family transcriptional activator